MWRSSKWMSLFVVLVTVLPIRIQTHDLENGGNFASPLDATDELISNIGIRNTDSRQENSHLEVELRAMDENYDNAKTARDDDDDDDDDDEADDNDASSKNDTNTVKHKPFSDVTDFLKGVNGWDFSGYWVKNDLNDMKEDDRPVPTNDDAKDQGVFVCMVR